MFRDVSGCVGIFHACRIVLGDLHMLCLRDGPNGSVCFQDVSECFGMLQDVSGCFGMSRDISEYFLCSTIVMKSFTFRLLSIPYL